MDRLATCRRRAITSSVFLVVAFAFASVPNAVGHAPPELLQEAAQAEIARHPQDPEAHLAAGRAHRASHAWDAALAAFDRAGELGADSTVVATAKGQVFLEAGWPRMAERELTHALEKQPDAVAVRYDRARARMALGDPEGAAEDFERAIAGMHEPRPEHVYAWRDALIALGKRAEAISVLDDWIARVGPIPSLQLAALDLELELGRYREGLRRLDALLATSPQNPAWVAKRADVLDRLEQDDAARRERSRALAMIESRRAARRGTALNALAAELRRTLAITTASKEDRR